MKHKHKLIGLTLLAIVTVQSMTVEAITVAIPPKPLTATEKIMKAFPNDPVMLNIAIAESGYGGKPCVNNDNPTSSASGCFQILRATWKDYKCDGLFDEAAMDDDMNIACAVKIEDRSGTTPWNESKHSWSKMTLKY